MTNRDWIFGSGDYTCDVRVAGVLVRDGKILLQREKGGSDYALPGGHVQLGETTEAALLREYKEEIGADIRCEGMLWSEECFWEWQGKKAHSFTFYYRIALADDTALADCGAFVPHRDNAGVEAGWVPVSVLQDLIVYPDFLKKEISRLDGPMKHFVTRA